MPGRRGVPGPARALMLTRIKSVGLKERSLTFSHSSRDIDSVRSAGGEETRPEGAATVVEAGSWGWGEVEGQQRPGRDAEAAP